jgi:hypothetical protein
MTKEFAVFILFSLSNCMTLGKISQHQKSHQFGISCTCWVNYLLIDFRQQIGYCLFVSFLISTA